MEDEPAQHGKRKASEAVDSTATPQASATEAEEPYKPPMTLTPAEELTFEEIGAMFSLPPRSWINLPPRSWINLQLVADVEEINLRQAVHLIHETSGEAYRASSIGWDSKHKLDEMKTQGMRMITVLQRHEQADSPEELGVEPPIWRQSVEAAEADGTSGFPFLGMLNYLPVIEGDPDGEPSSFPALYIYEMHMLPSLQGRGFGGSLMQVVEDIAEAMEQKKIMLTVFTSNTRGRAFYERLGYSKWDEEVVEQPKRRRLRSGIRGGDVAREPSYIIMAKDVDYYVPELDDELNQEIMDA